MVFVVDDESSVRKSLGRLLQTSGYQTETFPSVIDFLNREHYDGVGCLVLDVYLRGLSGVDAIARLQEMNYDLPVVFITGYQDTPSCVTAMKRGAVDYLVKPVDVDDLLRAVREGLDRRRQALRIRSELDWIKANLASLTPREYEVLRYVVSGQLNKQIAQRMGVVEKTIKVHRSRVMRKMHTTRLVDLVRAAEKMGIPSVGERSVFDSR